MFLDLADVQRKYPSVTQGDLDALEQTIREYTNNHFIVKASISHGLDFKSNNQVTPTDHKTDLRINDTIEIWNSGANDGLYIISAIDSTDGTLTLNSDFRSLDNEPDARIGLVVYPKLVLSGAMKLIEYDQIGRQKLGVKSETVSRVSMTYFDTTTAETRMTYPSFMMGFLDPYITGRWD